MQGADTEVRQRIAQGDAEGADLPESERALLRFVALLTREPWKATAEDAEVLREHWSDAQIAECVYVTALFAFFNRVADAFGLEDPNYVAALPQRPEDAGRPDATRPA